VTPLLLVGLGGALGSATRYLVGLLALRWLGPEFPYGTLLVNLVGSYAIGVVHEVVALHGLSPALRVFLATGVLGGFTTYSAFSLDTIRLAAAGAWLQAALYVVATTTCCLALAALGIATGRGLGSG
jgi:fluoride exporter